MTGLLVAGELATGTFYLLMLALGCIAGALTSYVDSRMSTQVIVASLVGGGAVLAWHIKRRRGPAPPATAANRNLNLDVGERLNVETWNADRTARVHYRGAQWSARFVGPGEPAPGTHVIEEVRHNELALRRA